MRQFIDGLHNELREHVEISCPTTIAQALIKAKVVEASFSRRVPLGSYSLNQSYLNSTSSANIQNNSELSIMKKEISELTE